MIDAPACVPRSPIVSNLVGMIGMERGSVTYLELGTAANETLGLVARMNPAARCIGVDLRAVDPGLPNVTMYTMTTTEYLAQFAQADGPFNVAYIDADHSFRAVRDDFISVWNHMAEQSLILLDDTWPGSEGATDPGYSGTAFLMYDWLRDAGHEFVTIPASPGLTIVRKSSRHLGWA